MSVLLHVPPHSMVSSSGAKPSGHLSKQRPLCRKKPDLHLVQKSLLKQDSQFSILHPGGGRRERGDSSGSEQPSHLELIES